MRVVSDIPWFKVDDTIHSHPKMRRASLSALGLWAVCGSYCMSYKTDGFVPGWFVVQHRCGGKLAAELVRVGLWENATRDGEAGYQFHDWLDYQQSAEEIERDRIRARDRQRQSRARLRQGKKGADDDND